MAVLSFLAATCLIICAGMPGHCTLATGQDTAAPPVWRADGELVMEAGRLSYQRAGATVWDRTPAGELPYRIVTDGPPALLTTVGADLELTTYALGKTSTAYPACFPLLTGTGWSVLAAVPVQDEGMAMSVLLLDGGGGTTWSHDSAMALWPEVTTGQTAELYLVAMGHPNPDLNTLIFPFGVDPQLISVSLDTGEQRWVGELTTRFAVADAELLILGDGFGLLSLQYDYLMFELVAFDTASGAVTGRHSLFGITAQRLVYPGPDTEYIELDVTGNVARLLVNLEDGGARHWEINLESGELVKDTPGVFSFVVREDNPHPVGGAGIPGPTHRPFPQELLPVASGDSWRIPALVDQDGNVAVVTGDGARFVNQAGDISGDKR